MNELQKIYDVPLVGFNQGVKANEYITFDMTQEFKNTIESGEIGEKNNVLRAIINMNEGCVPVGLKYIGFNSKKNMHRTEVYYYNPTKEWLKSILKK